MNRTITVAGEHAPVCAECGHPMWVVGAGTVCGCDEPPKEFVKYDKEKPIFALIPPEFEEAIAKTLTSGARKYSDDNWKLCKTPWRTYYSALRRHLSAVGRGERLDPDSGESHLAHAACCILFLHWFCERGLLEVVGDDNSGTRGGPPATAGGEDATAGGQEEPGAGVDLPVAPRFDRSRCGSW